jgi:hypothetical protein
MKQMAKLKKFWDKFKNQPDLWFFFGFLLTFTLSVRKVLFYFPIQGAFNEYTGIYVYVSDIFLLLVLLFWLISILHHGLISLSMCKLWITGLLHRLYVLFPLLLVIWSFISVLWSQNQAIAIFRSIKLLELYLLYIYVIYRIVPQLMNELFLTSPEEECSTLAPLNSIVPRGTIEFLTGWNILNSRGKRGTIGVFTEWNIFYTFMAIGLIQSLLAIGQFISQKSLHLTFLKESIISPFSPGVAKIILNGNKLIRAYGFFPHPNILGGFLVFSIAITLLYIKFCQACPTDSNCSTWNNWSLYDMEHSKPLRSRTFISRWINFFSVEQSRAFQGRAFFRRSLIWLLSRFNFFSKKSFMANTRPIKAILALQLIALLLSFSKSAIIGLLVGLLYIFFSSRLRSRNGLSEPTTHCSTPASHKNVPHFPLKKMFHVEQFRIPLLVSLILIVSGLLFIRPDLDSLFGQSLRERSFYLNVSRGTISHNLALGVGSGQFITVIQHYSEKVLEPFEYQPVHNIFLLIWSELGLVGLILFILILWQMFHVEHSTAPLSLARRGAEEEIVYLRAILLGFIFIMLFDHYFWDIWPGQGILWLTFGLIIGLNRYSHLT